MTMQDRGPIRRSDPSGCVTASIHAANLWMTVAGMKHIPACLAGDFSMIVRVVCQNFLEDTLFWTNL